MSVCSGVSPGLDLAARKLPEPCHGLAFGALGQQDPTVRIDERAGRDEHDGCPRRRDGTHSASPCR